MAFCPSLRICWHIIKQKNKYMDSVNYIKFVVVGDIEVGKTRLLKT